MDEPTRNLIKSIKWQASPNNLPPPFYDLSPMRRIYKPALHV